MIEVRTTFGTESQMPFAYGTGGIAFCLEHIGHSDTGCVDNQFRVTRSDSRVLLSPGIHARQQTEAGRSTGRGSGIGIGELYTLSGKAVDVGSAYLGSAIATQVTDAQVVGNQIYYIRFLTGVVGGFFFRWISASGYQGCAREKRP